MDQSEKQLKSQRLSGKMSDHYHAGVDIIREAIEKMEQAKQVAGEIDSMWPGNHTHINDVMRIHKLIRDLESICKNGEIVY